MPSATLKQFDELFENIDGAFGRESHLMFDFLLQYQQKKNLPGDLLEIGVAFGKSAGLLGVHTRPEQTLMLVDIVDRFSETMNQRLPNTKLSTHLMSSTDVKFSPELKDRMYRFIHIDAKHDASYVWNELDFANDYLSETGVIVLDDFYSVAYPQVTQAAYEFLADHRHELFMFLVGCNKAYLARPMYGLKYFEHLASNFEPYAKENGIPDLSLYHSATWPEANCLGMSRDQRPDLPEWLRIDLA